MIDTNRRRIRGRAKRTGRTFRLLLQGTKPRIYVLDEYPGQQVEDYGFLTAPMSPARALWVRRHKIADDGCSWRGMASLWDETFGTHFNGNQFAGMEICSKAAAICGESYGSGLWN